MSDKIQFGCFDTQTGNFQEGYMEGNKMKFKPLTLWQRIKKKFWNSPPKETIYVGNTNLRMFNWMTGRNHELSAAMYVSRNPYTHEIYKVWASFRGQGIYFNADAYKQGKLIME